MSVANLPLDQFEIIKKTIWFSPHESTSLRLTYPGAQFIVNVVGKKEAAFSLSNPITNKNLLRLERYFPGIYFLPNNKKIVLFEQEDISMLALLDGNLISYLEKLEKSF